MVATRHVPAPRFAHLQSKRHHQKSHSEVDSKAHQLYRSDPAHAVESRQAVKLDVDDDMIPGIERQVRLAKVDWNDAGVTQNERIDSDSTSIGVDWRFVRL